MQTGSLLSLYRHEARLTQGETCARLGCTQSVLSKWEKNGIPERQRQRVLDLIMPILERANRQAVIRATNGSPLNSAYLDTNLTVRAMSRSAAASFDLMPDDCIGRNMRDINPLPEIETFFWNFLRRGMFSGQCSQAFLHGIRYRGLVYSMRIVPIGLEIEGRQGITYTFTVDDRHTELKEIIQDAY